MKRISKIIILCLTFVSFQSCKNLKIIDNAVFKTNHIPGLANLAKYSIYSLTVDAKEAFTIESIELIVDDKAKNISSYSFIDKKTNAGYMVTKKTKVFEKGTYTFSFRQNQGSETSKETFVIKYSVQQKQYTLNLPIKTTKQVNDK